jgi:hypothetical protein
MSNRHADKRTRPDADPLAVDAHANRDQHANSDANGNSQPDIRYANGDADRNAGCAERNVREMRQQ